MRSNLVLFIGLATLGLAACGSRKNTTAADMHTAQNSLDWQGTYTGVLPAADGPGIYRMIAIDSTNFEMLDRYIERDYSDVTIGEVAWNTTGDSITIGNTPYFVAEGLICTAVDTLYRISEKQQLPTQLTTTYLLEDKTGKSAVLRRYTRGEKQFADFEFMDKHYAMAMNEDNTQANEYTDGTRSLEVEIIDPAPVKNPHPVFTEGDKIYEFTIVSPSNALFVARSDKYVPSALDVTYYNGPEGNYVMLLNSDYNHCYLLPQSDASAKTAEYTDGNVKWTTKENKANFEINGGTYKYKQRADK